MGEEVSQAGSLVNFERLRFDFNAPRSPTAAELAELESLVNGWIGDAVDAGAEEMAIADAKAKGATAMFGEKYGDVVRVVDVPGVSMELCGGTHVGNTAEIGGFKILAEAGVAAGVRRIEAVSGPGVVDLLAERDGVVTALAGALRVPPEEITGRVSSIQDDLRAAQKEAEALRAELAAAKSAALVADAVATSGGQRVLVARLDGVDPVALKARRRNRSRRRSRARRTRRASRWCSGRDPPTGRLGSSPSLTRARKKPGAQGGRRARAAAKACGGGGGGKPGFAQAGGRDASKLDEALEAARTTILEARWRERSEGRSETRKATAGTYSYDVEIHPRAR